MTWRGRRLLRDRAGNVTMLFAGSLTMLIAVAGLAVDAGSFFLQKRRLQGIADAAALSAANDLAAARDGATAAIAANGGAGVRIDAISTGRYLADATRAANARFDPAGTAPDAVRIRLSRDVPTFFGQFLTGKGRATIVAQSTAARINMAAFSIGSRLAAVQGGLPNALLSGLAGTELSLSVIDYQALVSGQVDVLRFAEGLRSAAQLDLASFGELIDAPVTLPQMANALAAATTDQSAAAILRRIATRLPTDRLAASRFIDLGPLSTEVRADPTNPIKVDAYGILQAMLEAGGRNHYVESAIDFGIPGVAGSTMKLAIGDRMRGSPWLSVGPAGDLIVRTSQLRLYIDSRVSAIGIGMLRIPIFIELAQATARLAHVSCTGGRSHADVILAVKPSVGEVALADFNTADFTNLGSVPQLRPAEVARIGLDSATGFADVSIGGVSAQDVAFSSNDITAGAIKTVSTHDIAEGVVSSLAQRVTISVSTIGGLGLSPIGAPALGAALTAAAVPLDTLVDQVTALVGVRVGQADVRVNGVRCGTPLLVE